MCVANPWKSELELELQLLASHSLWVLRTKHLGSSKSSILKSDSSLLPSIYSHKFTIVSQLWVELNDLLHPCWLLSWLILWKPCAYTSCCYFLCAMVLALSCPVNTILLKILTTSGSSILFFFFSVLNLEDEKQYRCAIYTWLRHWFFFFFLPLVASVVIVINCKKKFL